MLLPIVLANRHRPARSRRELLRLSKRERRRAIHVPVSRAINRPTAVGFAVHHVGRRDHVLSEVRGGSGYLDGLRLIKLITGSNTHLEFGDDKVAMRSAAGARAGE